MDASAQTAIISNLTLFKSDILDLFALVVPIAGVVLITIAVATWAIRTFGRISGLYHYNHMTEREMLEEEINHTNGEYWDQE